MLTERDVDGSTLIEPGVLSVSREALAVAPWPTLRADTPTQRSAGVRVGPLPAFQHSEPVESTEPERVDLMELADGTTAEEVLPTRSVQDLAHPDGVKRFMRSYRRQAMVLDVVALAVGTAVACAIRFSDGTPPRLYSLFSILLAPVWLATVASLRGYESRFLGTGPDEYRRVLNSGLIFMTTLAVIAYAVKYELSRGYVLVAVPVTVALALLGRHLLRHRVYRLRLSGRGLHRVIIAGRADSAAVMIDLLRREPEHGLVPVGLCLSDSRTHGSGWSAGQGGDLCGVPVVGTLDGVAEAVDATGADVVAVVSHPDLSGHVLRRLAWALEERNVELVVSPGIIEVAGPRLSIRPVAGLSLLHLERPPTSGGRLILKSTLDRLAALMLVVIISPILLAAAVAVRVTSPGPVLYRQRRVGVDGRPFSMLKFRSMVDGAHSIRAELDGAADNPLFKLRNDPRVTPVGAIMRRYSVDELPQLWNVVRGEMSLVGPRPPLPEEAAVYSDDATRRLRVKPGMTGLWQVSGRSDLTWEEALRLDLRYVDNWSWALDLSILWRTSKAIFGHAGAY